MGRLYRVQIVFGVISPKRSKSTVTTAVAITTPVSSGSQLCFTMLVVTTVAYAAVAVLIILLPIRIVLKSLSVFCLIISSDFAPNFPSLTAEVRAGLEMVISAISVPEKKAERKMRITNMNIETGSKR